MCLLTNISAMQITLKMGGYDTYMHNIT